MPSTITRHALFQPVTHASNVDAGWQAVPGTISPFLVYSAFYDTRPGIGQRVIRVIGVKETERPINVTCKLFYDDNASRSPISVNGSISAIHENGNKSHTAVFALCPLPDERVPESVSVVANAQGGVDSSHPFNPLRVLSPEGSGAVAVNSTDIAVCVKQLNFNISIGMQIIQFIELNKLLGVTHFIFYNHTVTEDVSCILKYYAGRGEATIWQFDLHKFLKLADIHEKGQLAAQNDCLYRNMNKFHYLGFFDIDEFIVPHGGHSTIQDMIKALEHKENRTPSYYSFRNAFFFHMFPDAYYPQDDGLGLFVLRKTRRIRMIHPHFERSKYICIPRRCTESGIHFIWRVLEGRSVLVSPNDGLLHHYRKCDEDCLMNCTGLTNVVDKRLLAYKKTLVPVVKSVLADVHKLCPATS